VNARRDPAVRREEFGFSSLHLGADVDAVAPLVDHLAGTWRSYRAGVPQRRTNGGNVPAAT